MQGWLYLRPFISSKVIETIAQHVRDYCESTNMSQAQSEYAGCTGSTRMEFQFSVALYDAIMLYAHAATSVLNNGGDLTNGSEVAAAVQTASYMGMGGSALELDEHGDRIESYEVMNYAERGEAGMDSVAIGLYNTTTHEYISMGRAVVWPGNTKNTPIDKIDYQEDDDGPGTLILTGRPVCQYHDFFISSEC